MTIEELITVLQKVPVKNRKQDVLICRPGNCGMGMSAKIESVVYDITNTDEHIDIVSEAGDCRDC